MMRRLNSSDDDSKAGKKQMPSTGGDLMMVQDKGPIQNM